MRNILIIMLLALSLFAAGVTPARAGQNSPPRRALTELEVTLRMSPPVLEWFNEVARPTDIASFVGRGLLRTSTSPASAVADATAEPAEPAAPGATPDLSLLDQVTTARKQVIVASIPEAEQLLSQFGDKVDIVGYNLEHWPQTPAEEQADPVAAVQRLRALTDEHGVQLALGPDRRYTAEYGPELAPYAHYYVLQLQRLQADPAALHEFADPLIAGLRQANPDLRIVVQLRTEGTADELLSVIDSLKDGIDGVMLLTNVDSMDVAQDVVARVQAGGPLVGATPTPFDDLFPRSELGATPTPLPLPAPDLPPLRAVWPTGLLLAAAGMAGLATMAGAAYIIWSRSNASRRRDDDPPDGPDAF